MKRLIIVAALLLSGCADNGTYGSSYDSSVAAALILGGIAAYGQGYANAYQYQPTVNCYGYTVGNSANWSCQ